MRCNDMQCYAMQCNDMLNSCNDKYMTYEIYQHWLRVKIWGVYRCPSLLLSRLEAELSGKEKHTKFRLKKCPSYINLTGYERFNSNDGGRFSLKNKEEDSPHRNKAQA